MRTRQCWQPTGPTVNPQSCLGAVSRVSTAATTARPHSQPMYVACPPCPSIISSCNHCSPSSAPWFSSDISLPLGQTKPQTLVGCIPPPAPLGLSPFPLCSPLITSGNFLPGRPGSCSLAVPLSHHSWPSVTGWPHRLPGAFNKGPFHMALLRAHSQLHAAPAASHRPLCPAKTCPRCQPGDFSRVRPGLAPTGMSGAQQSTLTSHRACKPKSYKTVGP